MSCEGPAPQKKLRLDAFLTSRLPELSRSQLQHGIRDGLVSLNGNTQLQKHTNVRPGDMVRCTLPPPPATSAIPEVGSFTTDHRTDKRLHGSDCMSSKQDEGSPHEIWQLCRQWNPELRW